MTAALLAPGSVVGVYRIQRLASSGGTAQVYQAQDALGQPFAIKLLTALAGPRPELMTDPKPSAPAAAPALQALQAHAALGAALRHPHIVQCLDGGTVHGRTWLAYEWVSGTDLTRYTQTAWLLPLPLVREVGLALASALDHAHRAGWLHRDLKPANVRVNLPERIVKLADFGIAKPTDSDATLTGVLQGTPTYMSPEQLLGETPTARSDLYALGVLLYEMVSGRPPHTATTLQALLQQTSFGQAQPLADHAPSLPEPWAALIHRLLAREPQQRPADARAVIDALTGLPSALRAPG